ncbi:MAG: sigma-70 family RNA polymerase sigma factor [Anaerolineae bacterium]|nr:sigma-70 family RNA polymerase sigma factor [Anaerolineae bacterium]
MVWSDQIQVEDEETFATLFQQYKNLVFKTAYLMLGNAADAEDALQEVFLSVHCSLNTFDPSRAAFTTWLYRITVNHCLNRRRKRNILELPLGDVQGHHPSPESQIMKDQALEQLLNSLSDKLRAVVVLRYYADLPYADIGEILDVPLGTVKSRLSQALCNMRKSLGVSMEEEGVLVADAICHQEDVQ